MRKYFFLKYREIPRKGPYGRFYFKIGQSSLYYVHNQSFEKRNLNFYSNVFTQGILLPKTCSKSTKVASL